MSAYQGRFAGRTAVVTGGASGLGKASAARIVAEGGKVVLWDLNEDALKAAAEEVGAVATVALDVADPAAVEGRQLVHRPIAPGELVEEPPPHGVRGQREDRRRLRDRSVTPHGRHASGPAAIHQLELMDSRRAGIV